MTKGTRQKWAVGISIAIVGLALLNGLLAWEFPIAAKAEIFGQWLSGVAGALALVWLAIGYLQQGEELELQRQELAATREQLTLQREEMARLADEAGRQATSASLTEAATRQNAFFVAYSLLLAEARGPLLDVVSQHFYGDRTRELVAAGDVGLQQAAGNLFYHFARPQKQPSLRFGRASQRGGDGNWVIDANGEFLVIIKNGAQIEPTRFTVEALRRFVDSLRPVESLARSTGQMEVYQELQTTSAFLRLKVVLELAFTDAVLNASPKVN